MHILKNVIFQASLTKDCEAEEMNVQKKRLESTLRIFILLITKYEQNISISCHHCMFQYHNKNETRLKIVDFFPTNQKFTMSCYHSYCPLTSKKDSQLFWKARTWLRYIF